jgi:hypothetical protein
MDPWRVVQLVVDRGTGLEAARGSGFLTAPGRVLTAAHVIEGASAIQVRLDAGQETEINLPAVSWWADPGAHEASDLAVVMIPEDATAGRAVERALFGRIGDGAAVLNVAAFGFPLFKARNSLSESGQVKVFRDFEQATGHAPAAANRRQGTLAFYLDDPPPGQTPGEAPSPWEGMSGGPVLVGDRIVGVVAEHHPSEGPGRLTVRRIDRAYEKLSSSQVTELIELLRLPSAADFLPDVVPRSPGEAARSAYLAQVGDIAPGGLIGRDDELAAWAGFCAGGEAFAWWQGDPWAGKTALASWFVLHPPLDVDVVSFFVTGRLIGQADSEAFLTAMVEQLNSLYPAIGRSLSAATGARTGQWLGLLAAAGAEAESRGRRLVVVVDGLDEDEAGAIPSRGFPSIASLLPRHPPSGVRFIITSRPNPGLPDDLSADHPLRACAIYRLPVSAVAKAAEFGAKQELRDLLGGDQAAVDVVGYIAGSGGGLTRADLSTLTGAPPYRVEPVLRGVSGRSLSTRAGTDPRNLPQDAAARVYLFAHDTLQNLAQEQLGDELAVYRGRVCAWMTSYADAGWPGTTPGYAVRGYPRLLIATGDAERLSALVRDPARHQFLSQATGSDYAAVTELEAAQSLVAAKEDVDLGALVELAAYRRALLARNEWIPGELPLLWARLDRFDHAEALARTLPDPAERTKALANLAAAAARSGELDKAEAIAGGISEPIARAYVLTDLMTAAAKAGELDRARRMAADAKTAGRDGGTTYVQAIFFVRLVSAMAEAGDVDGAEALAHATDNVFRGSEKFAGLVTAVAVGGDLDRAEAIARSVTNDFERDLVLTKLVAAVARAGDLDRASAIARTLTRHHHRAEALITLLPAAAEAGDPDRWRQIADDAAAVVAQLTDHNQHQLVALAVALARAGDLDRAEAIATSNRDGSRQGEVLTALVAAVAQAGDLDRAESIARAELDWMSQADLLTSLIPAAAQAGDYARATKIAVDVEALADDYADVDPSYAQYTKAMVLAKLASAAVQAGDLDRAQALLQSVTHRDDKAKLLSELVDAAIAAGDLDRARALVRTLIDSEDRAAALVGFMAAMHAGDLNQAETLVRTAVDPADQARFLNSHIAALIQAGDLARAEALANIVADPDDKAEALARLADAAMEAGDIDRAYRLTTSTETTARVTDSVNQDEVLLGLVTAARQAGDLDHAEALIRTLKDPAERDSASIDLTVTIAATGDPGRAEALARSIGSHFAQSQALTAVASAAVRAGNLDCARRLAADAADIARTINHPAAQSAALADVALTVARAGDLDEAETILRSVTAGNERARAITGLIGVIAGTGDIPRVNSLLGLRSQDDQAEALTAVARAATLTGNQDLARTVADLAEREFRTVCDFDYHADVLAELVAAMAWAGNLDGAEELTRFVLLDSRLKNQALAHLVAAATQIGDIDRAAALALSMTDPLDQADTLISLASVVGRAGDLDRAESLIWIISRPRREDGTSVGMFASPVYKAKALTSLVLIAGEANDMGRVSRLAAEAEAVIGGLTHRDQPWPELLRLADALGEAGNLGYSAQLLAKILNADWPETGWIKTVAQFFPSAVGRAWDILSGAD